MSLAARTLSCLPTSALALVPAPLPLAPALPALRFLLDLRPPLRPPPDLAARPLLFRLFRSPRLLRLLRLAAGLLALAAPPLLSPPLLSRPLLSRPRLFRSPLLLRLPPLVAGLLLPPLVAGLLLPAAPRSLRSPASLASLLLLLPCRRSPSGLPRPTMSATPSPLLSLVSPVALPPALSLRPSL